MRFSTLGSGKQELKHSGHRVGHRGSPEVFIGWTDADFDHRVIATQGKIFNTVGTEVARSTRRELPNMILVAREAFHFGEREARA